MKKVLSSSVCLAILLALLATTTLAGTPKKVVTMVTSDDVNRAAMAIKFTHAAMKNKGMKATIFFNVNGVHLVDSKMPSPIYPTGESIQSMLKTFMDAGGTVVACPMCMKNIGGMTNADLIPGVVARKGAGLNEVTGPDTLVLNY